MYVLNHKGRGKPAFINSLLFYSELLGLKLFIGYLKQILYVYFHHLIDKNEM